MHIKIILYNKSGVRHIEVLSTRNLSPNGHRHALLLALCFAALLSSSHLLPRERLRSYFRLAHQWKIIAPSGSYTKIFLLPVCCDDTATELPHRLSLPKDHKLPILHKDLSPADMPRQYCCYIALHCRKMITSFPCYATFPRWYAPLLICHDNTATELLHCLVSPGDDHRLAILHEDLSPADMLWWYSSGIQRSRLEFTQMMSRVENAILINRAKCSVKVKLSAYSK